MSSSNEKSPLVRDTDGSSITNNSIQCYTPFDGPEMKFRPNSSSASVESPEDEAGLPLPRAIFVVTNAALGAGMLNFPQAYSKTGGVGQALAVQAFLIVLIIGAFFILGYCGQVHRTMNYQDTVKSFCGSTAQIICQVIVILYMFGSNVTYLILIGDQLVKVIDHPGPWYSDRKFIITVVSCLCILPLCIPKKLKVISYSSLFGSLGALYVCLMVAFQYYCGDNKKVSSSPAVFHWTHVFAAVPVICFGFQCHVTSVAVYAELNRPTITRFGIVTVCATVICTVIYSFTGAYGFLTFGHGVDSDILVNYKSGNVAATVARVIIVFVVFSTYAICHFVGRSAFIGLWIRIRRLTTAEIDSFQNKRRIITSLVWFFASLAISLQVPNIGKAIAIVGGFAAHFIFTFPGLCLVQLILQDGMELTVKMKLGLIIGCIYVFFGMFLFGETVTLALMEDIEGNSTY